MQKINELSKIGHALFYQRDIKCGKILGEGVFGQVVSATTKNGEAYAIKLMPYTEDSTDEAQTRIRYQKRELELLERMKLSGNSNVIKYFKSWLMQVGDKTKLCIQMELCSESLGSFVYKNKDAPKFIQAKGQPLFYRHVFQQILYGLHAIHSIGWVHRDIHPGNILVVNPNPQKISDIAIKIGDFGFARYIATMGIEFHLSAGWTIIPIHEKLSPSPEEGLYTAPELLTDHYDSKVDLYSAGLVLYFISRYLERNENTTSIMRSEIAALKQGTLKINEYVYHKDDKELCGLIENLTQRDRIKRKSAFEAMKYMFPTHAKDSTDAGRGASKVQFYARKENEDDLSLCSLNQFTLSAITEAVRSRIGVTEIASEDLRQEREVNGKRRYVKINCDEVVEDMFQRAAKDGSEVVVVVRVKPHEDNCKVVMQQPKPEQAKEGSSSESP